MFYKKDLNITYKLIMLTNTSLKISDRQNKDGHLLFNE